MMTVAYVGEAVRCPNISKEVSNETMKDSMMKSR